MKAQLEKMLAVIVIAIVVAVFFEKLDKLVVVAERESVQQTVSAVRVAIKFYALQKIISGQGNELRSFDYANPINMMTHPPINYLGEYSGKNRRQVPSGNWFFDSDNKHLVYKASHKGVFISAKRKAPLMKYVLRFVGEKNNDIQQDAVNALSLKLLGVAEDNSV